jgi:acetyl-CoA decarbonylase/synthase complex subunit gamma
MTQRKSKKASIREISPIDVYTLLPRARGVFPPDFNCNECGQSNCMAFATKLVNREIALTDCPILLKKESLKAYETLREMLKPPISEVTIGPEAHARKIGGKYVMYRHEFTYTNPTAIAIDVTDEMPDDEVLQRVKRTQEFLFEYIGSTLTLDMIAVRSTSNDPEKFKAVVKKVADATTLPLILCSFDAGVLEAGLMATPQARPLLYAATKDNWKDMAELALMYKCPLAVYAPNDLKLLRSLAKTLIEYGVPDLVLDPGTLPSDNIGEMISNFTMLRRAAAKRGDEYLGFPLIGTPIAVWGENADAPKEVAEWKEAHLAATLIDRYADILIMHSTEGWVLLPNVVLRQNIYTDPRKPVAVEPGVRVIGTPHNGSPVMFTTNFALTYYTVASDIESAGIDSYLLVVDSEGIAVDCAVAGRKLTADKVAEALKEAQMADKVQHRKLIIPGKAARLSGEIEESSGWEVMVGPRDSSDIPRYLSEKWK